MNSADEILDKYYNSKDSSYWSSKSSSKPISQPKRRTASYKSSFGWFNTAMNDKIILVDNLPLGFTVKTLQEFFHPENIPDDKICMMPRKRRAFIACSSLVEQFELMKRHKTQLENRIIEIEPSSKREFDKYLELYKTYEFPSPVVDVIQHYPERTTCFQFAPPNKKKCL